MINPAPPAPSNESSSGDTRTSRHLKPTPCCSGALSNAASDRQLKISTLILNRFMGAYQAATELSSSREERYKAAAAAVSALFAAINYFEMDIKWKSCHSISSRCRITKSNFSFNFGRGRPRRRSKILFEAQRSQENG
jgi:hypothetical protein